MTTLNYLSYLLVMAIVTYLVRTLPFIVFRTKVDNKLVKSFLYYVPYAVLGSMTFPVIIYSTGNIYSGIVATSVGLVLAYKGKSMVFVAVVACLIAYIMNLIIM
ncbi:MAG: AzlD domain-containing protein [Lachnospiraceae bacterium]|nr:AzlD domain-containing protein [Lachnospiraceae bacterium]